jgi:hypothetical protein
VSGYFIRRGPGQWELADWETFTRESAAAVQAAMTAQGIETEPGDLGWVDAQFDGDRPCVCGGP